MTGVKPPARRALTQDEVKRLFAADLSKRDRFLFELAMGGPFSARDLVGIDLGHVLDAAKDLPGIEIIKRDGRVAARKKEVGWLSEGTRLALGRYVDELVAGHPCPHLRGAKLGVVKDPKGMQVCAACRRALDPRKWPLFSSLLGTRLSPSQARKRFQFWRDALGLSAELQFESLRATYRAKVKGLVQEGFRLGQA